MLLRTTYLLNFLLVPLLEIRNIIGPLLGLLYLLPRLHLLLLEQGDSVGEELGVPLDAGENK